MNSPLEPRRDGRARRLAARIRSRCLEVGWDATALAREAGISRTTAHHLLTGARRQPHLKTLQRVAKALDVSVTEFWSAGTATESPRGTVHSEARAFDRGTNPAVAEVVAEWPRLFADWNAEDWDELYSTFGVGGALSPDGVRTAAAGINRKRETVRQVQLLLETHLSEVTVQLVETLYRLVRPDANLEHTADLKRLLAGRPMSVMTEDESGE